MKVYIVEPGEYSDRFVVGVYSSMEKAIATHPYDGKCPWVRPLGWPDALHVHGWVIYQDWAQFSCGPAEVREYEVDPA